MVWPQRDGQVWSGGQQAGLLMRWGQERPAPAAAPRGLAGRLEPGLKPGRLPGGSGGCAAAAAATASPGSRLGCGKEEGLAQASK